MCALVLEMSAASAQTRQETVDFIFHNAETGGFTLTNTSDSRDHTLAVTESECVVTLNFHWTLLKDQTQEVLSHDSAIVKIYFGKLIMSSATVSGSYLKIAGTPGAVVTSIHYESDPKYNKSEPRDFLELYLPPAPLKQRILNALTYFVSNFCKGNPSQF